MKAFEAWWESETDGGSVGERVYAEAAWKFATERAAKIADEFETKWWKHYKQYHESGYEDRSDGAADIAAAIRSEE